MLRTLSFSLVKFISRSMHLVLASFGHGDSFLFIQFDSALGSAIHETPVYEALKKNRPECHITVVCGDLVYGVIKRNPNIDSVVLLPDPHQDFILSFLLMVYKTLPRNYANAITTAGNRQSRRVLLALLSGARKCFGFTNVNHVYDDEVQYDMNLSLIQNNLNSLLPLGIKSRRDKLRIYFSKEDHKSAISLFKKANINSNQPICLFITQTSGGQPIKDWWPERFAQLADKLYRTSGLQIVFIGSKKDAEEIEKIRSLMMKPSVSIAGMTDITTLAAVFCMSDLAVTLDTGPMHLGTAVDLPMVLIASAWDSSHEWLPLDNPKVIILKRVDIPCKECYNAYCHTRECMKDIGVLEVYSNVMRALNEYPPLASARLQRVIDNMVDTSGPKLL
jgi:ADP-heptose:LPS heptosyltransferase